MADLESRYYFGSLERKSSLAGFRASQIAAGASSLTIDVVIMRGLGGVFGLVISVAIFVFAIASVTYPIYGRCLDEWIPLWIAWTFTKSTNTVVVPDNVRGGTRERLVATPRGSIGWKVHLFSIQISHIGEVGVIFDGTCGRYSIVLPVSSGGFTLLEASERDQRVTGWSNLLASIAASKSPISRVQWITRSAPGGLDTLLDNIDTEGTPRGSQKALLSYLDLLSDSTQLTANTGSYVVFTSDPHRPPRQGLFNGLGQSHSGYLQPSEATTVLISDLLSCAVSELNRAELCVEGVLDRYALGSFIKSYFCLGSTNISSTYPENL